MVRTNIVDEMVMATPAISQGRILLRTVEHLYCIKAGAMLSAPKPAAADQAASS